MRHALGADPRTTRGLMDEMPELRLLFHRLNNQLGVILAHAELLHAKVSDDANRARAAQVVASALEAMGTARALRRQASTPVDDQL
jgi:putative heme degradation protein